MNVLEVENLGKSYSAFRLQPLTFSVPEGRVVGLAGANGAGKSTTLKSIVGLIASEGDVRVCGVSRSRDERACKRMMGYAGGGFRFYPQAKIGAIVRAVKAFYPEWSKERWKRLCRDYALDEGKRVSELSEGMKVKLFVALALSHGARLLVLDEPTSGLDPLSREEFCDCISALAREGTSVLFSTHIMSDLEKVADDLVYLSRGKMLFSGTLQELRNRYSLATFSCAEQAAAENAIGVKETKEGWEGLVPARNGLRAATLDEIIVHLEREERKA